MCWKCGHLRDSHEYNHSPGKGFCGKCFRYGAKKINKFAYHAFDADNLAYLERKYKEKEAIND